MAKRDPFVIAGLASNLLPPLAFGIALYVVLPPEGRSIIGSAVSAVFVFVAIRWFNRRDDPRHAKRPPDAP